MKIIKKVAKLSSSIHQRIREGRIGPNSSENQKNDGNGFIHYEHPNLESFKSNGVYDKLKKIQPKLQNLKRFFKSVGGKFKLWLSYIDWNESWVLSGLWFANAFVEGIIANWWTHKIFGLEFGVGMILAHGFLITQLLDLYQRTKKDGESTKLHKKK